VVRTSRWSVPPDSVSREPDETIVSPAPKANILFARAAEMLWLLPNAASWPLLSFRHDPTGIVARQIYKSVTRLVTNRHDGWINDCSRVRRLQNGRVLRRTVDRDR
jgi:hypothetical protein